MEDFLPIIAFIIIMIISVVRNIAKTANKAKGGKQPTRTFGEVFPQMEILQPEIPDPPKQRTPAKKEIPTIANDSDGCIPENIASEKRGCKVAINNKSDAKKAFIYSEIFNKKYN